MPDAPAADPTTGDATTQSQEGLLQALQAERAERQRLAAQLQQQSADLATLRQTQDAPAQPAPEPKAKVTAAQVQAAVEAGRITAAEGQELLNNQMRDEMTASVTQAVTSTLTAQQREQTFNRDINRYAAAIPELADNTSPQAGKVLKAFNRLVVDLGYDGKDPRTRLLALENAFGDVTALERTSTGQREHQEETAGGGSGGDGGGDGETGVNQDGSPKNLTARERAHYKGLIDKGIYAGWDQVKEELGYKRPGLAERAQSRFGVRVAQAPGQSRGRQRQQQRRQQQQSAA